MMTMTILANPVSFLTIKVDDILIILVTILVTDLTVQVSILRGGIII